jgi:hypothetical protein
VLVGPAFAFAPDSEKSFAIPITQGDDQEASVASLRLIDYRRMAIGIRGERVIVFGRIRINA